MNVFVAFLQACVEAIWSYLLQLIGFEAESVGPYIYDVVSAYPYAGKIVDATI